jgi:photosystem II stability/assembly factor-like uncharacterized protein
VTPTPAPDFGPWNLVRQIKYSDPDSLISYGGFLNDSFGILVGVNGVVKVTYDGADSWIDGNNQSWCRFGLDIVDDKIAWHCGNPGHVRVTIDGGKNWTAVADFGSGEPNHCRYLSFLDEKTGWAATPAMLGATADGAVTWTDLTLPEGIGKIAAISLRSSQNGYLLDDNALLYETADGGTTWTSQAVNFPFDGKLPIDFTPWATMKFWDANHGRIVIIKNGFWTGDTTDGGATWTWKEVPALKRAMSSYMSHDGQFLTSVEITKREITLLKYDGS